jgi:hypothetical protein
MSNGSIFGRHTFSVGFGFGPLASAQDRYPPFHGPSGPSEYQLDRNGSSPGRPHLKQPTVVVFAPRLVAVSGHLYDARLRKDRVPRQRSPDHRRRKCRLDDLLVFSPNK